MAAKKKVNKTDYIKKHGGLSAPELVAKAKKDGIKLSDKYVYNIRAKIKAGKTGGRPGRPPSKVNGSSGARGKVKVADSSVEQRFKEAVLDVGLGRAEELLGKIREAVASA